MEDASSRLEEEIIEEDEEFEYEEMEDALSSEG